MEDEERILELIRSREHGILQNELWREANIDRRKCSRIVDRLEKDGEIYREQELNKGLRTYRIKYIERKETIKDFKLLMVDDMFAPCTGCNLECTPAQCVPLSEWIFGLLNEE